MPGRGIIAMAAITAVTAAASNPTLLYVAVTACRASQSWPSSPSAAAAAGNPSLGSERSYESVADQAGSTARQRSPGTPADGSSRTDHSSESPAARSDSGRCGTGSPLALAIAILWAAASTSVLAMPAGAITDTTLRPPRAMPICTATSPATSVVATKARWPGPFGCLSTCASRPDHGLDRPRADPGARSNGWSQDTFVARAV